MRLNKSVWRLSLAMVLGMMLGGASFAGAQTKLGPKDSAPATAADLSRLKVGDEAPDFTLEEAPDKPITLSSYRGKKTVVLVFYRGYW